MANMQDLLGAMLGAGMTPSANGRLEHSLGPDKNAASGAAAAGGGGGGLGNILIDILGAALKDKVAVPAGQTKGGGSAGSGAGDNPFGQWGEIAGEIFGQGEKQPAQPSKPTTTQKSAPQKQAPPAGGLGDLGKVIFGKENSADRALGLAALALLGYVALRAYRKSTGAATAPANLADLDDQAKLLGGLRKPANAKEEQEVQSVSELMVKAMINAAKADGRIDEDELQTIVGDMKEGGISIAERDFLLAEFRKPLDTAAIVRAVPNQQVAAQIYAASLLATEADTPAERTYLSKLASDLKLDTRVIRSLQESLGVSIA